MRLLARLFLFASSLFILLYGILPGLFRPEGYFIASFAAGRAFLHGVDPTLLYKFPQFQRLIDLNAYSDRILAFVSTPPSTILGDAAVAILPLSISKFVFTAASLVTFVLLVHATAKAANSSVRTAYLVFISSSYALASTFQSGEGTIMLLFLYVMSFYALSIEKQAAGGVFLGFAFPFAPFMILPASLLLIGARWRAFVYFLATSGFVLLLTFVIEGHAVLVYYFQRVLPALVDGRILNPFSDSYQTAWSMLRRLFLYNETLNVHPPLGSATAYLIAGSVFKAAVIVPAAYYFRKGMSLGRTSDALAAASFPLIFLSTGITAAQLIMLAPAIVVLAQSALEMGRAKTARAFILLYALACLPLSPLLTDYLHISSPFLEYSSFLLLVVIYVLYIAYQSHVVPPGSRFVRVTLAVVVTAAVSFTFFAGERLTQHQGGLPLVPAVSAEEREDIAFSPAAHGPHLGFITTDSTSSELVPNDFPASASAPGSWLSLRSDLDGENYCYETVRDGHGLVIYRTRRAEAEFVGHDGSVSPNGDYGAFMRDGIVYALDLDPQSISPEDTLSLLPYRISSCSFNASRDNELVFLIDSLNSSYSIGRYDLFSRRVTTLPIGFKASLLSATDDRYYLSHEKPDSSSLWIVRPGSPPRRLLSTNAEIYDLTIIGKSLFLSSDYGRGLNYPTVYEYTGDGTPHGTR